MKITPEQRLAVIEEAKTWLNTPYHPHGRVKGAGTDCAMLLVEVYTKVGVVEPFPIEHYPPDWHLHRDVERYLEGFLEHGHQIESPPQPGDAMLVKFGHVFSHGAIVVAWPLCIHAMLNHPVCYVDADIEAVFRKKSGIMRERKFFEVGS